jgi:hypothetical protein
MCNRNCLSVLLSRVIAITVNVMENVEWSIPFSEYCIAQRRIIVACMRAEYTV